MHSSAALKVDIQNVNLPVLCDLEMDLEQGREGKMRSSLLYGLILAGLLVFGAGTVSAQPTF